MTQQQDMARHRGEFAAYDYQHDLRQGNAQFWDSLPALTDAEIIGAKNAEIEMEALRRVTGGNPALMRKVLAYRREVKQAASVAALRRAGASANTHPYSLVRQGARGPMASFDTWLARYQAMGRKTREFKSFTYQVKATDSGGVGVISGYLSTWSVDQGGDQIMPNAYDVTLAQAKAQRDARGGRYLFPILWSHDETQPIGGWVSAVPDSHGLKVTGELDLSTEAGRSAFSAASLGYVDGLSIGYRVDKSHWQGNVRVIDQITLYEGSLVCWPMSDDSRISGASLN